MTALEHLNFLSSPAKHWPSYSPLIKAGYKGESCLCARVCINHRPGITLLRRPGGEKYRTLRPGLGESCFITHPGDQLEEQGKGPFCSEAELGGQPLPNSSPDSARNTATGMLPGVREISRLNPLPFRRGQGGNNFLFIRNQAQGERGSSLGAQRVKDLALSLLGRRFDPGWGTSPCCGLSQKKKRRKKKELNHRMPMAHTITSRV